MTQHIRTATLGGVATIEIARPEKKNALTVAMYQAMADALRAAQDDPAVRAVLITGQPGIFTSGNDIEDFMARPPGAGGSDPAESPVFQFMHALLECDKPVVAAVTGAAIGIGTTMLLHCDLVYASASARFRTPFADLGLTPEGGSSLLLPALVGPRGAAQWLLLGDEFSAEGARDAGLLNAVVPDAEVAALEAAARLAKKPPGAILAAKELMKRAMAAQVAEVLVAEGAVFAERLRSQEAMAALLAFRNKAK